MTSREAHELLRTYYRSIGQTMLTKARGAITSHHKLIGEQRERVVMECLEPILPKRFQFGRGEVMDAGGHRSNEADVVIWDAQNYPSIQQGTIEYSSLNLSERSSKSRVSGAIVNSRT